MTTELRRKQRFENLQSAYGNLQEAVVANA